MNPNALVQGAMKDSSSVMAKMFQRTSESRHALERFLTSRLDINRLRAAAEFIEESVFKVCVWPELGDLRGAVTQRELRRAMRYRKYRDHTCHTLWGFLLGCLWFERSKMLRGLLDGYLDTPGDEINEDTLAGFASAWTLGFLCHDIGYLFESDIPGGLTPDPLHDLHAGCALLNDFYQLRYLKQYLGSSERKYFDELRRWGYPFFSHSSLASVVAELRSVPFSGCTLTDGATKYKVPETAFQMFRHEKCPDVEAVETMFEELYYKGRDGQKFLDHGVCSGLMMLQLLVLGYGLYMIAHEAKPKTGLSRELRTRIRAEAGVHYSEVGPLTVPMMRTRIRWIYAATRHNLTPRYWTGPTSPFPLRIDKDCPSYLVALMDTIQDWDRPRLHLDLSTGDYLMDSADIHIEVGERLIVKSAGTADAKRRLDELAKDLTEQLHEWDRLVAIG